MIEVMAAAKAAVKFGSAAMAAVAAVTLSVKEFCGGGDWWPKRAAGGTILFSWPIEDT